jgi:lipid A disaccharide synthetase
VFFKTRQQEFGALLMKITTILKYASLATLVLGVAVGCSSTSQESTCSPQQVKDAIAAAKAANERAKSMKNEWRDTAKIIQQAEKAEADGKCDEALNLANKARNQAEDAVAQAEKE